jgi:sugar lactone lactonase YvrE
VDAGGNLFIADSQNNRIRRVDFATHVITTVAGSGNQYNGTGFFGGFSGDGGPAISALLNFPVAVAVDGNGNLFIADSGNNVIRKVDNSPTHIITTFAGNGTPGTPGAANGDGGAATAAQLSSPEGVAVDPTGNVFIGDSGDSVVRMVDTSATPIITTYAGNAAHVFTFSGDGGPANQAGLNNPEGVAADSSGNLYIADTINNRIRKVDNTPAHNISTFAGSANICLVTTGCGDGAAATSALLNSPTSVAVDGANGNVFLCDSGTQRYRMVVAGATPTINAYAGGGAGGDGSAATSALIGGPPFVTVDSSGDLLLVDGAGARIRKVNANTQVITNFAGNGIIGPPGLTNGDGGPATQANLSQVNHGIAIGPSGDL